jgi:hypothetical protein
MGSKLSSFDNWISNINASRSSEYQIHTTLGVASVEVTLKLEFEPG